jgi:hypothetical protein
LLGQSLPGLHGRPTRALWETRGSALVAGRPLPGITLAIRIRW